MSATGREERPHAFVVMPFAGAFDDIHRVIAETVDAAGLESVRADDIPRGGPFIDNIYNAIERAAIVIGVTSSANPNVAYELGYARHLDKEAILLTDDPSTIPSDLRDIKHLVYEPSDLRGLSRKLGRWVANSDFSQEVSRKSILRRGEVFETVVDGAFYLQRTRPTPSRDEIKAFLGPSATMPQRLLYLTEDGQTSYLNLCDDPKYTYYQETLRYVVDKASEVVECVLAHSGAPEVDFISLGPGNGRKDAEFLGEFLRRTTRLGYTYYYPYDVSGGLLLEAMRTIFARDLPLDKLRVKAIEADVAVLREFKRVFDYRPAPNVYSLLGGLANMATEVDLLKLLWRLMNPEDCLLLEVRRKSDARALGNLTLNRQLDLAPLRYVGAEVDRSKVHYDEVLTTSAIPSTRTIAATVPLIKLDRKAYENVSLFAVHYYEAEAIRGILKQVGFKVLMGDELANSLFYVCTRA